jgi:hypothetical protein
MTGEGAYLRARVLPFLAGSRSAAVVQPHLAASDSCVRDCIGAVGEEEYPTTHLPSLPYVLGEKISVSTGRSRSSKGSRLFRVCRHWSRVRGSSRWTSGRTCWGGSGSRQLGCSRGRRFTVDVMSANTRLVKGGLRSPRRSTPHRLVF